MRGLINNERDRDNLNFLLNTNDLFDWYDQSDEDDKLYAAELLDAYSRELKLLAAELEIEAQLDNLQDAKEALKKFAL